MNENNENFPVPRVPEIEQAVLAAIIRSDGAWYELAVSEGVSAASFYEPFHRRVFEAVEAIQRGGGKADLITVCQSMPDDAVALAELDGSISTAVNFPHWLRQLREFEAVRMVRDEAFRVIDRAALLPRDGTPSGVIGGMSLAVDEARRILEHGHCRSLRRIGEDYAAAIVEGREALDAVPWFAAGTEGDFQVRHLPGRMYALCAKTGCGKTALAAGAVMHQLKKGLNVAYFCTETDSGGVLARITSQFCGVPHHIVGDKYPDAGRLRIFADAMRDLMERYDGRLFVRGAETGTGSADGIAAEAKRIRQQAGRLDVIVVDYLQDLRPPQFLLRQGKNEQMTYAVDRIHETLTDCRAAGIVLVQLNREGMKTAGLPGLQHIKDCSTIEQKSHAVLFIHRDESSGETLFYSRKARDQAPVSMKISWNGVGYDSQPRFSSEGL